MRRILAPLVLLAALAAPSTAAAQDPQPVLADCDRSLRVTPLKVTFTCADGGFYADALQWQGWGAPAATATGVAPINDCDPSCAEGSSTKHRITLTAEGLATCRDGSRRYTVVRYAFPDGSPFPADAPASTDPSITRPCPTPRPTLRSFRARVSGGVRSKVRLRYRFCAPAQTIRVFVDEEHLSRSGVDGINPRVRTIAHRGGCTTRRWRFRMALDLQRLGFYRVRLAVMDEQGQRSRTRTSRRVFIRD